MKMTMTATGDSILNQGFQDGGYEGFEAVKAYIGKGQARFANLETCVTDGTTYASANSGGTWLTCPPRVLDKLLTFGFNFLGFANNHTMDWGPDGLLQTLANARERNMPIAGAGKDLAEAASPVYRDLPGGRVALIAVSSSFYDASRAGNASRTIMGRPGVNPLRYSTSFYLNEAHFAAMQEIAAATKINGEADLSRKNGFAPPLPEGVAALGGLRLCLSPDGKEYKRTVCNKHDLARTLDSIKDARYIADYVVIMLHSHQIRGAYNNEPDDFAVEFCRACLDAGADVVFGGGTHEFKPVEIYKGKPIFYSLGNFCFQSNVVEHQPSDILDKFNLPDMSDVQALAARNGDWKIGLHTQIQNFRTVVPYLEFEDGKLVSLEMAPVELGFDEKPRSFRGIPYRANERQTREIYEYLSRISREQFGTEMVLDGDVIRVPLA